VVVVAAVMDPADRGEEESRRERMRVARR
jgi:hypothetical protein